MLRTLTVAAVLATAAAAMPAAAAEFGGFRVEAQGGWNSTSIDYTRGGLTYNNSKSSFGYGGEIGYDMPVSETIIIGANANFAGSTQSYSDLLCPSGTNACLLGRDNINANLGFNWALMARAGFKVADSTLLYGAAGYAQQNVKYYITPVGGRTQSTSENYGGFRLAAGVEQAFAEKFYGKLEYRYSNYQSGVTTNQITAGVGIRF